MTDITDQEREVRRIMQQMQGYVNNEDWYTGRPAEWLRDLREVFPASAPTLSEDLANIADNWEVWATAAINTALTAATDSAKQMEHDLAEARAEVERLAAERYPNGSAAQLERDGDAPSQVVLDPADVKPGEAWEVIATDPAKSFGGTTSYNTVAFRMTDRWIVSRQGYQTPLVVPDDCIRLVRRHVPAPRVITNPDEIDRLAERTIVRDQGDGEALQKISGKWIVARTAHNEGYSSGDITPVTVLWEPEA